jgi:hypothetical protein
MPMKQNIGKVDKIVRIVLAVVLAALAYYFKIWWIYIFAAIMLVTALVGFCGLYTLLGISTCPVKKQTKAKKAKKK